jgi:SpoIID/LytB domain protein
MLAPSMTGIRRLARRALIAATVAAALIASATPARAQTFDFPGRGWGHGLGMSQWGARGLAEKGLTASEILKRYYTGISVQTKTSPSEIRVGLLQERAEIYVEADGAIGLYDSSGTKKASGKAGERWTVRPKGSKLEVLGPGSTTPKFTSGVPVTVRYEATGAKITLPQTGKKYGHGRLDIDINAETGKTRAIMILPFEQYLYGLAEMPASWHHEALEAQAIAGRTYALEKIGRLGQARTVCNCAVYASTVDQVYAGTDHEVSRWVTAVNETKGLVATYGGKPIQAYYSSSSGGFTENNENVFGGKALPYLRGVCDTGDYVGGENPNANWKVSYESTEVQSRLREAGHNVGTIRKISYLQPRGVSGRVLAVKDATHGGVLVDGTLDDARLSGSTWRQILELKSNLLAPNITGGIRLRYDSLSCKPGLATGTERTWKDEAGTARGREQTFANGRLIYGSVSKKVFYVQNSFLERYDAAREAGTDLGLPTADGASISGGKLATFENGNIYVSKFGARIVTGAILAKYVKSGGPAKWGMPTSDELAAPNGGRSMRFEKARIYWSSKDGARVIYGAILARYLSLGGASGKLGMPTSDEYGISTGRRQDFTGGYITYNSTTKQTAYKLT